MGTKQENEITVKIKCEINELRTILEKKGFNNNGDILNQQAINCDIFNIDEAVNLFEAIEYYKIMNIVENDIVYGKDDVEIAIKDINNGDKLIEVETVANNNKINTIEKIKKQIIDLEIPIDATNFFVKKAEIEFEQITLKVCDVRLNNVENYCNIIATFRCQRQFLHKDGKWAITMTQPDLILKLIEQLIAEKEKNIKLQSQLEEYKKGKD